MNEFIEQFLLESRELVEQAVSDLLTLEARPTDRERLDGAFRAVHTLKGAAGIVDFDAMGRALHAAEDRLSALRSGDGAVTPDLIGACLNCLDQVVQWLDVMDLTGEPPTADDPTVEAAADAIIALFKTSGTSAPAVARPADDGWILALRTASPGAAARSAIRYTPKADCFFAGIDPLTEMAALPGLISLHVDPNSPWPDLGEFNPFDCRVTLTALSTASPDAVAAASPFGTQIEVVGLEPPDGETLSLPLSPAARSLIEAQILMLEEEGQDGWLGRLASAGRAAVNVLGHQGRWAEAQAIAAAGETAEAKGDPGLLRSALRTLLEPGPSAAADRLADKRVAPSPVASAPLDDAPLLARDSSEAAARTLRVDIQRIDALVKLSGELMVAKNALGHAAGLARNGGDPEALAFLLDTQHAQLDRLVGQLQTAVLSLRVLPLRQVFQRFPRLVRDIALSLGKPAQLLLQGEATEADKTIVEALFEPLLHVVRNAMDHGVEPPDHRAAIGKPAMATVQMRAARRGDHVVVEVEDDGQGVDLARVRQIAAERGIASPEALAELSDGAVMDLIFAPGFSTARAVTELSGRGVGLDAVRSSVSAIGGEVTMESRPGIGSITRFTLPFTVMMTSVITVEVKGQVFGVPLDVAIETLKLSQERIFKVGAARAFVLRGRTLPLISLAAALGDADQAVRTVGEATVVVGTAAGETFGVEVDRIGETMDVMLKPMDGLLAGMPGVAGATLLGDGRVLIVLDLAELL